MKKMFMAVIALMMTISASAQFYIYFSDGNVAKVDSISMVAPKSAFFDETPESRGFYTPSEAIAAVDAGLIYQGDSIKVGGIISRWYKKSSSFDKYHSVTFFVKDPVTGSEHEFEFYCCYSLNKGSFATFEYTDEYNAICVDVDGREFHLGDTVVGAGKYTIYNGTHELNTNCYLTEWRSIVPQETDRSDEPSTQSSGIGVFSVGEDKTVTFSKGNLQYHPANDEWRFAENQTDYIGDANSNISATYNGWIDLFCWSTSATNFGVSTSVDYSDYFGSFIDWGSNQIGTDIPNTWRTLTDEEWAYLTFTRTNADILCGVAKINGVNGLVFLPDSWTCPDGVNFMSGFGSESSVEAYGQYQTLTAEQWSKMERSGAVFFPASGGRSSVSMYYVQYYGYYWAATGEGSNFAHSFYLTSKIAGMGSSRRYNAHSVRLVKDLQ